jgi:serine/threonine-protein kinase SBK
MFQGRNVWNHEIFNIIYSSLIVSGPKRRMTSDIMKFSIVHTDVRNECFRAETSHDVWQFGIVIFVCVTGCLPWQKAGSDDPRYARYLHWHGSTGVLMPVRRPKLFKLLTSRAQRMFRKFLEPRADKRPGGLADLVKFSEDRWLTRTSLDRKSGELTSSLRGPTEYVSHSSREDAKRSRFRALQCIYWG